MSCFQYIFNCSCSSTLWLSLHIFRECNYNSNSDSNLLKSYTVTQFSCQTVQLQQCKSCEKYKLEKSLCTYLGMLSLYSSCHIVSNLWAIVCTFSNALNKLGIGIFTPKVTISGVITIWGDDNFVNSVTKIKMIMLPIASSLKTFKLIKFHKIVNNLWKSVNVKNISYQSN